jgi:hypothetical protein
MLKRFTVYGTVVIASTLASIGGLVYSQNVPGKATFGSVSPKFAPVAPMPPRKIPRKYCRKVDRPPAQINMCLRDALGNDPICKNYCVEVTQAGKYCDESPNSTCQARVVVQRMRVRAADCFENYTGCGCQNDWRLRTITVEFLTCD